jgi:hypothetical protein
MTEITNLLDVRQTRLHHRFDTHNNQEYMLEVVAASKCGCG